MIEYLFSNPIIFLVWAISLLVAITVHEFAHAFAADRLGDPTPRLQGRLTLNPIAHLDPLGTLMLILIRFGWGKPVEFDPYNLKNPKRDSMIIALAGPLSNLILASILSIILRFSLISFPFSPLYFVIQVIEPIIYLNIALAIFNLIPIHPLDGGKILIGLLPKKEAYEAEKFLQGNSFLLLVFMLLPIANGSSIISHLISPVINFVSSFLIPNAIKFI